MSLRYYIFLKDVLVLALTSFGGPQAHIALMFKLLVEKRRYLTDQELIELNALCQILPGPTSTQTITAIGFFHFHSKGTWLKTFNKTGLRTSREIKLTPFISSFILTKDGNTL